MSHLHYFLDRRELQDDFLLRKYSVIIVDEAHERSLNTDILLGMLSRVLPLRRRLYDTGQAPGGVPVYPLKLVIMSATLRVQDFTENRRLFPSPPPVIHVSARQFPVTVHFAKRTELDNFEAAAYRKVLRIHKELPPGGILVFLTGQREVENMCKKLREAFPRPGAKQALPEDTQADDVSNSPPFLLPFAFLCILMVGSF